jgi:glycine dehydrogenase
MRAAPAFLHGFRTFPQTLMLRDLDPPTDFIPRHIGPSPDDQAKMLREIGVDSLQGLVDEVVPHGILMSGPLDLPAARSEPEALAELRDKASRNLVLRSYIGQGY